MFVFISWSGDRSKLVAETLQDWLPKVIQNLEPWISPDIPQGRRWTGELANRLRDANLGIFCLTPENLISPWLLYEAGAVSKSLDANVCTFLIDVKHGEVGYPLAQFQHTTFSEQDIKKLVFLLNKAVGDCGEKLLSEKQLDFAFDGQWPALKTELDKIRSQPAPGKPALRDQRDILEEILAASRISQHRPYLQDAHPSTFRYVIQGLDLATDDPRLILLGANVLRADFPWIYALGLDTYKKILDKPGSDAAIEAVGKLRLACGDIYPLFLQMGTPSVTPAVVFEAIQYIQRFCETFSPPSSYPGTSLKPV